MGLKDTTNRIILNISGEIYETYKGTLSRYPETVLGRLNEHHPNYCTTSGQYFFPRHRRCFEAILFFYQSSGVLRCPADISVEVFEEECIYFRLPREHLDNMKKKCGFLSEHLTKNNSSSLNQPLRTFIWNVIDKPHSSYPAWVYGSIILLANIISVTFTCVSTVAWLRQKETSTQRILNITINNILIIDLILRLALTPKKIPFFKSIQTWIDGVSVYAIIHLLISPPGRFTFLSTTLTFFCAMRALNTFRVMRFSKHFCTASKIILEIFRDTKMFFLGILLVVVLYGSVMNAVEWDGTFHDMEQACWWSMQTLTTLGYGDVYPNSILGKLIAGLFMGFGTQIILLPVMVIANKFQDMYDVNMNSY